MLSPKNATPQTALRGLLQTFLPPTDGGPRHGRLAMTSVHMGAPSPPRAIRRFPEAINEVQHRQNRMPTQHTRAGVPHYRPDLLSHLRLVAMHRALGASGLVFMERTSVKTSQRIVPKLSTFRAEFPLASMVIAAVEAYHGLNGFAFPLHSRIVARHECDALSRQPHPRHEYRWNLAEVGAPREVVSGRCMIRWEGSLL